MIVGVWESWRTSYLRMPRSRVDILPTRLHLPVDLPSSLIRRGCGGWPRRWHRKHLHWPVKTGLDSRVREWWVDSLSTKRSNQHSPTMRCNSMFVSFSQRCLRFIKHLGRRGHQFYGQFLMKGLTDIAQTASVIARRQHVVDRWFLKLYWLGWLMTEI